MKLSEELRNKPSRDNRSLLDRAADTIDELEAGYRKQVGDANFAITTGEWEKRVFIIFDSEKVGYRCSECNTTWDSQTPYCPNCGAKMKGD